jgi:multiple sugar transport system ATP-binding protein
MATVSLRDARKSFGDVEIIKGVKLDIADGEFCVFVGPSGCGKSALLRMIAGLEDITSGSLAIGGKEMANVDSADRGVAMVFQSYALYPHMTVRDNITFGLRMTGHSMDTIAPKLKNAADMLQLTPLLERKPSQLSGGQRQRVAIGRAIVREPDVFLFDEPLSNLDAALRVQMRIEISKLHQDLKSTMIYVTHDQVEAMTMADKIVVLQSGVIEQVGSPLDLYHKPDNIFVAGFIGSPKMNFLKASAKQSGKNIDVTLKDGTRITIPASRTRKSASGDVILGIRPEHIGLGATGKASVKATVRLAEYLGSETMFYATLGSGEDIAIKADGLSSAKAGEVLKLSFAPEACHLFAGDGTTIANSALV